MRAKTFLIDKSKYLNFDRFRFSNLFDKVIIQNGNDVRSSVFINIVFIINSSVSNCYLYTFT